MSDPSPVPTVPSRTRDSGARMARGVSDVLSPPLMTAVLVALATVLADRRGAAGAWRWALVEIALGVLLPLAHLAWMVHRGLVADIHLPHRAERIRPFLLTAAGTSAAVALAALLGAPAVMVRVFAAILAQTVLLLLVTLRWQISVHSASAAALATLVARLTEAPLPTAIAIAAAAAVGWARVRLDRHTPAQVGAGLALGAVIMGIALAGA